MYRMLIDGELVGANTTTDVINPVDESVAATVPEADVAAMDRAVAAAKAAFGSWQNSAYEERATVVRAISSAIKDNAGEIAALLIKETGRPMGIAQFEIGLATSFLDYYAEAADRA